MTIIENTCADATYNLAAEEYILEHMTDGDYIMMWINSPSVIIGKFQNPYGEVSLDSCASRGIGIYRRSSGGGTVYHDLGNVNYTIVTDRAGADYSRFLSPVISALSLLGVEARIEDTTALFCGEYKISGNAQSNTSSRTMHHGTLLYDTDLSVLRTLTGHAAENVKSKGIKSNPSPVRLIRPMSSSPEMTPREFADFIASAIASGQDTSRRTFTEAESAEIERIAAEKYRTWDWNFGHSPAFTIETDELHLESKHGEIVSLETSFPCPTSSLIGAKLIPEEIRAVSEQLYRIIF